MKNFARSDLISGDPCHSARALGDFTLSKAARSAHFSLNRGSVRENGTRALLSIFVVSVHQKDTGRIQRWPEILLGLKKFAVKENPPNLTASKLLVGRREDAILLPCSQCKLRFIAANSISLAIVSVDIRISKQAAIFSD